MKIYINPARTDWIKLCQRPQLPTPELDQVVGEVIARVEAMGDAAVLEYTRRFDQADLTDLRVTEIEINGAGEVLTPELKAAIEIAQTNIETFHAAQREPVQRIMTMPGVECWRKSVGIEKVGLYIPGGTAPLFSSVLMLGIPARLAGCREIVLCSPPDTKGNIHPAILYTAQRVGITQIYKVGGAQAIAAMALGTESIPRVYKIFGPGNQYVTAAKQLVSRKGTAIDMPAGPSEVLVVADTDAPPRFVAADLLSQAEHGVDSQVVLVTSTESVVRAVQDELQRLLAGLPRRALAEVALRQSFAVVLPERSDQLAFVNQYAPEHLILSCRDAEEFGAGIINAGSVFLGNYTPESVGDYASGTNHTLPTNGHARAYSGVSLDAFTKKITFQRLSPTGLRAVGPAVMTMARAEELEGHRLAVAVRLEDSPTR